MRAILFKLLILTIFILNSSFLYHGDLKFLIETAILSESSELLSRTAEDTVEYSDDRETHTYSRDEFKLKMDTFFSAHPHLNSKVIINESSRYDRREILVSYESKNKSKYKLLFLAKYDEHESHYHVTRIIIEEFQTY